MHQPQQFRTKICIFVLVPEFLRILFREATISFVEQRRVQELIDRVSRPVRFQEDGFAEQIIILKMKKDPDVMEILAQHQCVFGD